MGYCNKHYIRWLRHGDLHNVTQNFDHPPFCLLEGCGSVQGSGATSEKQGSDKAPVHNGEGNPNAVKPIQAAVGEPMDIGPSTVEVTGVYQSGENPPTGYGGHYNGTFVLVTLDYTNNRNAPVDVGPYMPLTLRDSKDRQYFTDDEEGYGATTALADNLDSPEEVPTANPGTTVHTFEAFSVSGEPGVSYTLYGSDLVRPQAGKPFEVDLGENLSHPTPPCSAPATAIASASVGASIEPSEMEGSCSASSSAGN